MWIVAVRANHLAFDNGMVRRQIEQAEYLLVALIARLRLLHRHLESLGPCNIGVTYVDEGGNSSARMWIMAVGASNAVLIVSR